MLAWTLPVKGVIVVCLLLQNCQLEQDPSTVSTTPTILQPPPPLTPISSLKSQTNLTLASAPLPKLQRIPRSDETDAKLPRLNSPAQTEPKGLVGGVTTWFPPSSTIQVGGGGGGQSKQPRLGATHTPRPQYVEFLGDKKYLIIPKHNVLSVSPSLSKSEENVRVAHKEPDQPNPASFGPNILLDGRESTSPVFLGFPREELKMYDKTGREEVNE